MIIESTDRTFYPVSKDAVVEFIYKERKFVKWYWWVLAALFLYPVLLVLLFIRRKVYHIRVNGNEIEVDEDNWNILNCYCHNVTGEVE